MVNHQGRFSQQTQFFLGQKKERKGERGLWLILQLVSVSQWSASSRHPKMDEQKQLKNKLIYHLQQKNVLNRTDFPRQDSAQVFCWTASATGLCSSSLANLRLSKARFFLYKLKHVRKSVDLKSISCWNMLCFAIIVFVMQNVKVSVFLYFSFGLF